MQLLGDHGLAHSGLLLAKMGAATVLNMAFMYLSEPDGRLHSICHFSPSLQKIIFFSLNRHLCAKCQFSNA